MFHRYEEKHVELYGRIERDLKEVQRDVRLVCAVPSASSATSSSHIAYLEDELTP
jgi:hypothetical protein